MGLLRSVTSVANHIGSFIPYNAELPHHDSLTLEWRGSEVPSPNIEHPALHL